MWNSNAADAWPNCNKRRPPDPGFRFDPVVSLTDLRDGVTAVAWRSALPETARQCPLRAFNLLHVRAFQGPAGQRAPPRARKAAGHIRAPSQNRKLASLLHATCEPQHKEYASRDLALALPQSQVLLRFAGALTDGHGAEERMNGVPRYLVRKEPRTGWFGTGIAEPRQGWKAADRR